MAEFLAPLPPPTRFPTRPTQPRILRAYDPANLATEYYNSNQVASRDAMDLVVKFTTPLVANGKVFVASMTQLIAYGLLP